MCKHKTGAYCHPVPIISYVRKSMNMDSRVWQAKKNNENWIHFDIDKVTGRHRQPTVCHTVVSTYFGRLITLHHGKSMCHSCESRIEISLLFRMVLRSIEIVQRITQKKSKSNHPRAAVLNSSVVQFHTVKLCGLFVVCFVSFHFSKIFP